MSRTAGWPRVDSPSYGAGRLPPRGSPDTTASSTIDEERKKFHDRLVQIQSARATERT